MSPVKDKQQFLQWLKPETPSDYERSCATLIEPVDYVVYSEKLNLILTEAMNVLINCGVSDMTMSGDVGVVLCTAQGDPVSCNLGTYLHLISSILPIKYILRQLQNNPSVGVHEGDFFYCNDPLYGNVHNTDQIIMMPIFHDGTLLAWAAATAHTSETGAIEPGGMPVRARSRHDEGMNLSPIRLGEKYKFRTDLLTMMENFASRSPRTFLIDLRSRVSCCDRVRLRINELTRKKGPDFLTGLFRQILMTAESSARERIRGWNDGIYRAIAFTDNIGLEEGLQRVALTLTKNGDNLLFDFTGTSPEHEGSYHAFPHTVVAHTAIYLFGWCFHDLPRCNGTLVPCEFTFPPGTVLSPREEAASSNSVMICSAVMSLLPQCFARLMFDSPQRDLVGAAMGNTGSGLVLSGTTQWDLPVTDILAYPLNTEGGGGRIDTDGVDAMGFPWCPAGRVPNVEDEENNYPIICVFQKYAHDSCGFGRYRGGLGTQLAITPLLVEHLAQMSTSKNSRLHTTQGLFGGYPPRVIPGIIIRNSNLLTCWAAGDIEVPDDIHDLLTMRTLAGEYCFTAHQRPIELLHKGDIFVEFSSGGAGYGDVLERDPESVVADLRNGKISNWVVKNVYCVVYDPETMSLDLDKTNTCREVVKNERCQNGLSYHCFLEEWFKLKPPEEILKYYGRWPDGEPNRDIVRL